MRILILDEAKRDLIDSFRFYEDQGAGLGSYFLTNLYSDIDALKIYGGIHSRPYKDYYRLLSQKFPFAIFYKIKEETVFIYAVLDCRRSPAWIRRRLSKGR
jgi:plasmid stabilization system protein ParE